MTRAAAPPRLRAIDRMRGLVMVLMTSDHAAHVLYRGHRIQDTALFPGWDQPLALVPFLHRWLSHVCAPMFVFLAGTAVALAAARRRALAGSGVDAPSAPSGSNELSFDRDLVLRGLLLIAIDLTLISFVWGPDVESRFLLQVLYAIGFGMVLLVPLRRLPSAALALLGVALLVGHEALAAWLPNSAPTHLLVTPGPVGAAFVIYPALPWLGMMLLGHVYGARLARGGEPSRPLWLAGSVALGVWLVVEALDGYGNGGLVGVHDSWLRWLQVSKYPPSLGFAALELGLGLLLLGLFTLLEGRAGGAGERGVLLTLGRGALVFYVLHIVLLELLGAVLGETRFGLAVTWLAVGVLVLILLPVCGRVRAWKERHPTSLLRLV
jgi:uncharacterized membrane protein